MTRYRNNDLVLNTGKKNRFPLDILGYLKNTHDDDDDDDDETLLRCLKKPPSLG